MVFDESSQQDKQIWQINIEQSSAECGDKFELIDSTREQQSQQL